MNVKNIIYVTKNMFRILIHVFVKIQNIWQVLRMIQLLFINEVIDAHDEIKTVPTTFHEKKVTRKTQNFYTLNAFLLITIALLIVVSIYCYLMKYRTKQKHLLQFHDTKSKQAYINNIN